MTKEEKIKLLYTNIKCYYDTMTPFWELFNEIYPIEQGWESTLRNLYTLLEIDEGVYDLIFDFVFGNDTITLDLLYFTDINDLAKYLDK
jgi:hypothetical protein